MKKIFKYLLFIILSFTLLFGLIYFGSSPIITGILSDKLHEKRIAGIYHIEFKHAYLNIFSMGINISDIKLSPDSSLETKKLYSFQKHLAVVRIKRVALINLDFLKLINENKIQIKKIKIIKPSIDLYKNHNYRPPPTKGISAASNYDLNEIHFNKIDIKGLSFFFHINKHNKADLIINKADIVFINPKINLNKTAKLYDAISLEDLKINLNNIEYYDKSGLYKISLKNAKYNTDKQLITINGLTIKPQFSKTKFAKKHAFQTDRFDATISNISINNFNVERFIKENVIAISSIDLTGLNLEVYRDKNYPFKKNKKPKLPQQALRAIKQKVEIGSITLKQSKVIYLEKAAGAKKTGKLECTDLQAQINYLGNTHIWQNHHPAMKVQVQTNIYGKGHLNISLNFPLKSHTFYMSGQMGKMKMTSLNAISVSNAGIKIRDGLIKKMDFKARLNSQSSSGTLNIYYQDLEISILKKQKKSGLIKDSNLLNFIANKIYLPKQNPNKRGIFYHGVISYERDQNKGLLNYLWKSIFSGLKDSILKDHKKNTANRAEKAKM